MSSDKCAKSGTAAASAGAVCDGAAISGRGIPAAAGIPLDKSY